MKTYTTALILLISVNIFSQDFSKNAATAKSAYAAGRLEDSRFAMEQMLRELDAAIGREILKLLPPKMGAMSVNAKDDNVSGGTGAAGLYVHRSYGATPKMAVLDIINNSPLMTGISTMLSMPIIGMGDPNQKQVKVQGYKGILRKNENTETGKTDYELQVPFNNTLLTLKVDDTNESEILNFASQIPMPKIAQMAQ
jgi:hypothetical protein